MIITAYTKQTHNLVIINDVKVKNIRTFELNDFNNGVAIKSNEYMIQIDFEDGDYLSYSGTKKEMNAIKTIFERMRDKQ